MKKLYDDYLAQDNVSDHVKVELMKDMFSVETGQNLVNSESGKADSNFPAFFALDLISFGLRKQIPAAIRLGELVMAEHCSQGT